MRVRFKGAEYEIDVYPHVRFTEGRFLSVELSSMPEVIEFDGGKPSPPGVPLPEIRIQHGYGRDKLFIPDDFGRVEPMEVAEIRRMPNVVSKGGFLILPVSQWVYGKDLISEFEPKSQLLEFPQQNRGGREGR